MLLGRSLNGIMAEAISYNGNGNGNGNGITTVVAENQGSFGVSGF